ncbi:MAG: hypothetical protein CMP68_00505 [Flavobacteriales bacterium]|nr:hypothetical protein [Flavobacteriales bacterium]
MNNYKTLLTFLSISIIFLFIFLLATDLFLKKHTNHKQLIDVPELLNKSFQEAHNELSKLNLKYLIINDENRDYNPNFKTRSVTSQNPLPFDKVKKGRVIYLTINADEVPTTIFPNIFDQPFRYAKSLLESVNLNINNIYYKNDIAKNVILKSEYEGVEIKKSDSLPIFSSVDLYIGTGVPKNQFQYKIPDLSGVFLKSVKKLLNESYLNLGSVNYDELLLDSNNVEFFIYKQSKAPTNKSRIFRFYSKAKAPSVDIWVTNDTSKLN